jgi:hypothetical protein
MKKKVYLENVEHAMLLDLAKKSHLKPDQVIKNLIQEAYERQKR